jgi:hypothetical protein
MPRRTLNKQSLRGQVSVKLIPEICINKASSNSRLTVAGRWATASDRHSQNCLQTLFFFLFFFSFDETMTELELEAEGLKFHLNFGFLLCFVFVFYLFFLFVCFGFGFFSPLMRQWLNYFWDTISRIGGWGTNTKIIKTETLLHLNLGIFFNPLSVSLMSV